MIKNLDKKIRGYALKNAIHYGGKANPGSVISALFNDGLEKKDAKLVMPKIQDAINEISKLSLSEQKKEYEKLKEILSERESREGLPELPDMKGDVIMRFRPAPSGPLHIGNMIGAGLPTYLYIKKYSGKFYVIVDDTDPEKTLPESYENIERDCDWMFQKTPTYISSSDRMDLYYEYAVKLIEKKKAYVCECSSEKFKELAMKKINCPCRKKSVEENVKDWNKMLSKEGFKEGESVLRFKSNMKDPNPAYRDFPLARINLTLHPKQRNKYRVWPLMNLVVAVDDMELKMTHIIRGKDHKDNAERQKMIFKVFKKKFPWTFFMGRIKFKDLVLSKRKLTEGIKSGEFSGEDDPKLATVISLKKRGYKPEAFYRFIEERGLTEVDKIIGQADFFSVIEKFNKII
ncbi:hypothetical protein COU58_02380 [Candidatus Pacearchaeota archaeon CG10_big_fil_rev_8_21_14_0_10_32_42]|nr:MAG: hypothetical protein COU58_02380 [Candidatus Pacearchaeota archaeon CG10_big_fil_rev_8_21_14_0_10_32_42]